MLNKHILAVCSTLKFRFRSRNSAALEKRACIVLACIATKRGTNIISRAGENASTSGALRYQLASLSRALFSRPIVRTRPAMLVSVLQLKLKRDLFPAASMPHSRIRSVIYFNAISRYDYSVVSFAVCRTALLFNAIVKRHLPLLFSRQRIYRDYVSATNLEL